MGGATQVVVSEVHTRGGEGGLAMADAIIGVCDMPRDRFRFLYELDWPIKKKIETIATTIYGAGSVQYEREANVAIERFERLGWGNLPICMAKTQYSLSHNPSWKGRPSGFALPVRDVRVSAGAGFLYPMIGQMMTMPAFGRSPAATRMDIDADGNISGLF